MQKHSRDLQPRLHLQLKGGMQVSLSPELGPVLAMMAGIIERTGGKAAGFFTINRADDYSTLLHAGLVTGPRMDIVENLIAGTPDRPIDEIPAVQLTELGRMYLEGFQEFQRLADRD